MDQIESLLQELEQAPAKMSKPKYETKIEIIRGERTKAQNRKSLAEVGKEERSSADSKRRRRPAGSDNDLDELLRVSGFDDRSSVKHQDSILNYRSSNMSSGLTRRVTFKDTEESDDILKLLRQIGDSENDFAPPSRSSKAKSKTIDKQNPNTEQVTVVTRSIDQSKAFKAESDVVDVEDTNIPPQINLLVGNAPSRKRSFIFPDGATVTSMGDESGTIVVAFSLPKKNTFSAFVDGCHDSYTEADSSLIVRKVKMRLMPLINHFLMSTYSTNAITADIWKLIQSVENLALKEVNVCCSNMLHYISRSIEAWIDVHKIGDHTIECNHTETVIFPLDELTTKCANLQEVVARFKTELSQMKLQPKRTAEDKMREDKIREQIRAQETTILTQQEKLSKLEKQVKAAHTHLETKIKSEKEAESKAEEMRKRLAAVGDKYGNLTKEFAALKVKCEKLEVEKNDCLTRLSKHVSRQITIDNPNIANLADIDRPLKLAERFSQLYDDQWTNLFDIMKGDEMQVISKILKMVKRLWTLIRSAFLKAMKEVTKSIQNLTNIDTTPIIASITEAVQSGKFNGAEEIIQNESDAFKKPEEKKIARDFIEELVTIFWLCQSRSVCANFEIGKDNCKPYTRSGKLTVMVWPSLHLTNGNLLIKGVAQGDGEIDPKVVSKSDSETTVPIVKIEEEGTEKEKREKKRQIDSSNIKESEKREKVESETEDHVAKKKIKKIKKTEDKKVTQMTAEELLEMAQMVDSLAISKRPDSETDSDDDMILEEIQLELHEERETESKSSGESKTGNQEDEDEKRQKLSENAGNDGGEKGGEGRTQEKGAEEEEEEEERSEGVDKSQWAADTSEGKFLEVESETVKSSDVRVELNGPSEVIKGFPIPIQTVFAAGFQVLEGDHYAICKTDSAEELGFIPTPERSDPTITDAKKTSFSIELELGSYKMVYVQKRKQIAEHVFSVIAPMQISNVRDLKVDS